MTFQALSVVSEVYPLIKTGGLADVAGALPAAVAPHGVELLTLIPGYPPVMKALAQPRIVHRFNDLFGTEASLVRGTASGLEVIALDAPSLFAREGGPYSDAKGADWPDNWRRFGALGLAAAEIARGILAEYRPQLVHAHDWQGGMAPAYLRFGEGHPVPSVMTVHNIAFPGWFPPEVFPALLLPPEAFTIAGIEYFGGVGFLKAGLQTADAITTVSPTYAQEIRSKELGMGLEGVIVERQDSVHGILNGIDTSTWNPSADTHLAVPYDAKALAQREHNKRAIELGFRLTAQGGPIFCVVSRLTSQKGMDVLVEAADALVAMGGRLAVLGSGDPKLETAFKAAAARHPGGIGVRIGYDEPLSHLLQGGSDAIIIPSRFEPCGLTQLYGLRYGCVPVAARTGGLADTIIDANEAALAAGVATGFLFSEVTPEGLIAALKRAVAAYGHREVWRSLQVHGMKADFSWKRSGRAYAELYKSLIMPRRSGRA
ncbi:MAG: glycogen synthase GlgA [Alphaproteobacteria bacterium]|nr:glycogen synthase GlgA [Alphaproteobacteria bacterium]